MQCRVYIEDPTRISGGIIIFEVIRSHVITSPCMAICYPI